MPLPTDRSTAWPPTEWRANADLITEARLWLLGDLTALAKFYASRTGRVAPSVWRRLVERIANNPATATAEGGHPDRLHVPLPMQIARTSAALLFSDPPTFAIPGAHDDTVDADGKPLPPTAEQQVLIDAEQRLAELADKDRWIPKLLQAAFVASGTGGVYLRPRWDTRWARPRLDVVHHDHAVNPVFDCGELVEVTFWREVERDATGTMVLRHLECHTPGAVEHGLFEGTAAKLGVRKDLGAHRSTANLMADRDGVVNVKALTGIDTPLCDYVPNVLPNRVTLDGNIGSADTAGLEDQLRALDSADTGWDQEVELSKRRILVPDQFLRRNGRGEGAAFDVDQSVYSPMNANPTADQNFIETFDVQMRATEFGDTVTNRINRTSAAAGYTADTITWAQQGGQAQTATEVLSRDALSADTTNAKRELWAPALSSIARKMLLIDERIYGGSTAPPADVTPTVVWPQAAEQDMREVASTLNLLQLAGAVSTDQKVRLLHPDWSEPEVVAEVDRIQAELGTAVVDPTGGLP